MGGAAGRLTIVDAFTRLCPGIDVRHTDKGSDVVETLRRVTAMHGVPAEVRVNGPEFVSTDLDL